jgi:hypothetical protein
MVKMGEALCSDPAAMQMDHSVQILERRDPRGDEKVESRLSSDCVTISLNGELPFRAGIR